MGKVDNLTVRDIIQRPLFKNAILIAGKRGVLRRVNWVHILEITNAAPFVNANDLILTTGLGLHQDQQARVMYMKGLIEQGASGLCVELGKYLAAVPEDMIELANQYDFPLIVFQEAVRFVDITQDVHSLIINHQHRVLKELESFSRKLQQLTLQTTHIHPILRLLYDYTSFQVIYYSQIESNKFVPSLSAEAAEDVIHHYRKAVGWNETTGEGSMLTIGHKRILSQPVVCFGQTLAYVGIVIHEQEPADFLYLLLDYIGKAVAHILLRKLFLEEQTLRNHNEFIQDILQNNVENEEQALQRMGLRFSGKSGYLFIGGMIEIEHDLIGEEEEKIESKNQDILILLRSLLKKQGLYSLLMLKNNGIYVLAVRECISDNTGAFMKEALLHTIEQVKYSIGSSFSNGLRIYAGFGGIRTKITEAVHSFKEAFDTLSVARALTVSISPFYEDLGIYQLIKALPEATVLSSFISRHLGKVLQYDRENRGEMLRTLDELLKCQGSKQETAKRLYIHRQTLYHRLEKLEELLGEDFLEPEKRMCLEFALRAYEVISPSITQKIGHTTLHS